MIQAGRDKTVPVLSVNTSSSGACTSQPHNVARRSSSDMRVLFELLCPKVAARFLTEDAVNNKSFSQCVTSTQPQVIQFINLRDQYTTQRKKKRKRRRSWRL